MTDDVLNIFDEKDPAEPISAPAEPPPADPPAEPTGEPEAAPPVAEPKGEARHVPYEALRDERAKRQAADRELAELRQWRAHQEAQQRQAQIQSIEDPDERLAAVQMDGQQALISARLGMSRQFAERQHGQDFVREVIEFFNDPQYAPMSHQFLRTEDPFGAAVEYFNAAKALREIGPDPKAYEGKLREQIRAELLAEINSTKPTAPPPSMASSPTSGGSNNPVGSGFDALFGVD